MLEGNKTACVTLRLAPIDPRSWNNFTRVSIKSYATAVERVCTKVDGVACKLSSWSGTREDPSPLFTAPGFRLSWNDKWLPIRPIPWSFCGSSASESRTQKINYHRWSVRDAGITVFECHRLFGRSDMKSSRPPSTLCDNGGVSVFERHGRNFLANSRSVELEAILVCSLEKLLIVLKFIFNSLVLIYFQILQL